MDVDGGLWAGHRRPIIGGGPREGRDERAAGPPLAGRCRRRRALVAPARLPGKEMGALPQNRADFPRLSTTGFRVLTEICRGPTLLGALPRGSPSMEGSE